MEVWLLWHTHSVGDEDDEKLIGVYSSPEKAAEAQRRMCQLPGFRDFQDGFGIDPYTVDSDRWTEGFTTIQPPE